jgi:hypothetical protein
MRSTRDVRNKKRRRIDMQLATLQELKRMPRHVKQEIAKLLRDQGVEKVRLSKLQGMPTTTGKNLRENGDWHERLAVFVEHL